MGIASIFDVVMSSINKATRGDLSGLSTAAEKCAIWRRKSVPVGLIKKGLEALLIDAGCEPRGA